MKIFAVRNHEVTFNLPSTFSRQFLNVETTIPPCLATGGKGQASRQELLELQKVFGTSKPACSIDLKFLTVDLDANVNPVVGGVSFRNADADDSDDYDDAVAVNSSQQMIRVEGAFLVELGKLCDDFRVKVTAEGLRWPQAQQYNNSVYNIGRDDRLPRNYGHVVTATLTTSEMQVTIEQDVNGAHKVYYCQEKITLPSSWSDNLRVLPTAHYYGVRKFCMRITIEIIMTWPKSVVEPFSVIKKMLAEKIDTDAVLVASCGTEIKCHKGFLSAHSAVLAKMFESGWNESKTSKIELKDMTKNGIDAFLEYLYYWGTDQPQRNSSVALELFEAGHKYDVAPLEKTVKKILLRQPNDWFDVNTALKLFLFAKNLEDGEDLATKSIQVLKLKFKELEASVEYQNLFFKHPKAAMKLCAIAFSI